MEIPRQSAQFRASLACFPPRFRALCATKSPMFCRCAAPMMSHRLASSCCCVPPSPRANPHQCQFLVWKCHYLCLVSSMPSLGSARRHGARDRAAERRRPARRRRHPAIDNDCNADRDERPRTVCGGGVRPVRAARLHTTFGAGRTGASARSAPVQSTVFERSPFLFGKEVVISPHLILADWTIALTILLDDPLGARLRCEPRVGALNSRRTGRGLPYYA